MNLLPGFGLIERHLLRQKIGKSQLRRVFISTFIYFDVICRPLPVRTVKKPRVHIQLKLSVAHTTHTHAHTQKSFVASSSSITFHQTCLKFQARTCQDNNVRANRLMSARTAAACEWNHSSTHFSTRPLLHCQFTYTYTLLSAQKVRQIKRHYTLYTLKLNKERIY